MQPFALQQLVSIIRGRARTDNRQLFIINIIQRLWSYDLMALYKSVYYYYYYHRNSNILSKIHQSTRQR